LPIWGFNNILFKETYNVGVKSNSDSDVVYTTEVERQNSGVPKRGENGDFPKGKKKGVNMPSTLPPLSMTRGDATLSRGNFCPGEKEKRGVRRS